MFPSYDYVYGPPGPNATRFKALMDERIANSYKKENDVANQQILEKAIQKAINNGWAWSRPDDPQPVVKDVLKKFMLSVEADDGEGYKARLAWETLFYSHPFAKALWPDPEGYNDNSPEKMKVSNIRVQPVPYWQSKLQKMVIAEDPIKYLEKNLEV